MNLREILRKMGIGPVITSFEYDEAADENVKRNAEAHSRVVQELIDTTAKITRSNSKLRASIHRMRTTAFAELETSLQHTNGGRARDG